MNVYKCSVVRPAHRSPPILHRWEHDWLATILGRKKSVDEQSTSLAADRLRVRNIPAGSFIPPSFLSLREPPSSSFAPESFRFAFSANSPEPRSSNFLQYSSPSIAVDWLSGCCGARRSSVVESAQSPRPLNSSLIVCSRSVILPPMQDRW